MKNSKSHPMTLAAVSRANLSASSMAAREEEAGGAHNEQLDRSKLSKER